MAGPQQPDRSRHPLAEEEQLVARCLRGEDAAWTTLFHLYHPKLLTIIRWLIHNEGGAEQAEEVAATVWSSLCSEGYSRLRRYDPRAGRLLGYLSAVARREIWRRRRSDRSRSLRERSVARREATWDEDNGALALTEFLATLTGREREFCLSELLPRARATGRLSLSATNAWQLRSRVLKKLRTYFIPEGTA
jgi:DNA-directed RNA polymerase specialized sigma24 family protein